MIKPVQLYDLLGKRMNDPKVKQLCDQLGDCDIMEMEGDYDYGFENHGLGLTFEDKALSVIMLYPEGRDGYKEYPFPIPHDLQFSFKKKDVHQALGKPAGTGALYDDYNFDDHVLHIEYAGKSKPISMITLLPPNAEE
jgi:hypothetical protein